MFSQNSLLIEHKIASNIYSTQKLFGQTNSYKLPYAADIRKYFTLLEWRLLNEAYNKFCNINSFLFENVNTDGIVQPYWNDFLVLEDRCLEEKVSIDALRKQGYNDEDIAALERSGVAGDGFFKKLGSKLKHAYSKLGRLQKGGKFLGKDEFEKSAETQIQNLLDDPKDQLKLVRGLIKSLNSAHPEFPNQESRHDFNTAVGEIYAAYQNITNQKEMDVETKNAIIGNLRIYVKDLMDRKLSDAYQQFEFAKRYGNILIENRDDNEDGPYNKKIEKSATTKAMESQLLPKVLKSSGAALGAIGVFLMTPLGKNWLKNHFTEVIKISTGGAPEQLVKSFAEDVVSVDMRKGGHGFQWMVQELLGKSDTGFKITAHTPAKEIFNHLYKLTGTSSPDGLANAFGDAVARGSSPGSAPDPRYLKELTSAIADGSKMTGDWGQFWLNHKFIMVFAKLVAVRTVKTVIKKIPEKAAQTMAIGGGLSSAGATIGALAAPLAAAGLTMYAGGAAISWLRNKGSRLKILQSLLDSLEDANDDGRSSNNEPETKKQKQSQAAPPQPGSRRRNRRRTSNKARQRRGAGAGAGGKNDNSPDSQKDLLPKVINFFKNDFGSDASKSFASKLVDAFDKYKQKTGKVSSKTIKKTLTNNKEALDLDDDGLDTLVNILDSFYNSNRENLNLNVADNRARSGQIIAERLQKLAGI